MVKESLACQGAEFRFFRGFFCRQTRLGPCVDPNQGAAFRVLGAAQEQIGQTTGSCFRAEQCSRPK